MPKKSSHVTTLQRIRIVQEWLMVGWTSGDIVTQGITKWDVDERTIRRYIKRAFVSFKNSTDAELEERRSFHIEARMKLFRELKDKTTSDGARAAQQILQEIAKLEGLHVEKLDVTSRGKPITGIVIEK